MRRWAALQHWTAHGARRASSSSVDPFLLLNSELLNVRGRLLHLLGSAHPGLNELAKNYFLHPSQQLRPLLVLLFSRATNGLGHSWSEKKWVAQSQGPAVAERLDRPLAHAGVMNESNLNMQDHFASFESVFQLRTPIPSLPPPSFIPSPPTLSILETIILPTQTRLAQIIEMIYVASLLHDDILEKKSLRQVAAFLPSFGNKLAVLGGDFLLGRASAALSRLDESEVVELVASIISNLVEGEILQMKTNVPRTLSFEDAWDVYLRQAYLKTASLMANGARAAVVLGGCREDEVWKEVAYSYGRNLGLASQLTEDALEYESEPSALQRIGVAHGPLLYAWEQHPDVGVLFERGFSAPGDVELTKDYVRMSSGVQRTRSLALKYADLAREALKPLPDSEAKDALEVLADRVVTQNW
ncbi:isoprenoid synthase domain-containing protein [Mycena floridula]|nr:isoprenoid synthase domain-containing protein [Mycena floridula]